MREAKPASFFGTRSNQTVSFFRLMNRSTFAGQHEDSRAPDLRSPCLGRLGVPKGAARTQVLAISVALCL